MSDAVTDEKRNHTVRGSEWRHSLAESTGNWAFVLSLSRRMVFTLELIRRGDDANCFMVGKPTILGPRSGHWIPAMKSLTSRGLVDYDSERKPRHKLTPAGIAVCKLLEYAGLIAERRKPVKLPPPEVKVKERAA